MEQQQMAKVREVVNQSGETRGYMIFCPACKCGHLFNTKPNEPNGVGGTCPVWTFNGDMDRPTFRASMLARPVDKDGNPTVCHSFVTDGRIEFLGDCTHRLAGQTVDLPDF